MSRQRSCSVKKELSDSCLRSLMAQQLRAMASSMPGTSKKCHGDLYCEGYALVRVLVLVLRPVLLQFIVNCTAFESNSSAVSAIKLLVLLYVMFRCFASTTMISCGSCLAATVVNSNILLLAPFWLSMGMGQPSDVLKLTAY